MTEDPTETDDQGDDGDPSFDPTRPPVTSVDEVVDDESPAGDDGSSDGEADGTDPGPEDASDGAGESVTVSVEESAVPDPTAEGDEGRSRERSTPERGRRDVSDRDSGRDHRSEADLERELLGPEERIGAREEYCHECGAVFQVGADECPECGNPFPAQSDPPASSRKLPQLAAALSMLLPGAGQLYNEQFGRATLAFFGTLFLVAGIAFVGLILNLFVTIASFFVLTSVGTFLMVLAILFGWFLPASIAAWDAYDQARKLNTA